MKLLGVVILYYPDKEQVTYNIASYLDEVDALLIWDNTPLADRRNLNFGAQEHKIIRRDGGRNVGLGFPLNEAVRYGTENGFTHLLTMDQDSCFDPGEMEKYKKKVLKTGGGNLACYGVVIEKEDISNLVEDRDVNITSGSIFPLAVFGKVGMFRDNFFIDAIDNEFCCRLKLYNYRIVRICSVFMHHTLGYVTTEPFLWGKLFLLNYSPMRTYYIIRNHIQVQRLYPDYHPLNFVRDQLVFRLMAIIFKENQKWKKLYAMLMGLIHGFTGRTGEYTIE